MYLSTLLLVLVSTWSGSSGWNSSVEDFLAAGNVSLTKCCPRGQHYAVGLDSCKVAVIEDVWTYIEERNATVVDSEDSVQKTGLSQCAVGFVGQSSTQFRFLDDGTLGTVDGTVLQSGNFCLDQVMKREGSPEFVARFCARDPCDGTECVRKCCPNGMAINTNTRLCQLYPDRLNISVQSEDGMVVESQINVIRDGAAPKCPTGINPLNPSQWPQDKFYILPTGELYVPANEKEHRTLREYCIETSFGQNVTVDKCYTF